MTDLKLYNTLTRQKETFRPIDPDNVRMYVCGPTVYDFAHIGNARPVIVFDVLYRVLRHFYGEDHVTYIRNITDVDDKINARALRDYGDKISSGRMTLNQAIREVTEKTANQFHEDVKALGCLPPTHEPRATEYVLPREDGKTDMVTLIQKLIDNGNAYVAIGKEGREVLFDVSTDDDYGILSNRRLEDQQAGARIEAKDHKKNPGDFVLWKESGDDPHHENEIAQSCCANKTERMAKVWMHNGYLQVEGKKMSKSEGNFVTIHDLLHTQKLGGRKWPGEVLRLAMLMTHYREPIDFSVRRLQEAESILRKLVMVYQLTQASGSAISANTVFEKAGGPAHTLVKFLADDLNTQPAIQAIQTMARVSRQYLENKDETNYYVVQRLLLSCDLLGLDLKGLSAAIADIGVEPSEIHDAITQRLALIKEKNWAEADRIRDELASRGIQLKDSKDSETGERITTWEIKR
ncbi:MAG: cysteine--tRNA ligase [Chloroflexota bacterium]